MGRLNYINLVEQIYRAKPTVEDEVIIVIVKQIFGYQPSSGTIQVWKTRLRNKGVEIPDKRRKK